jgi:hypothetical protein
MSLLIICGQLFLWSLLTILSGLMGGIGLAAGFAAFKGIKEKFSDMKTKSNHEKNRSYLDSLEQQGAGATVA